MAARKSSDKKKNVPSRARQDKAGFGLTERQIAAYSFEEEDPQEEEAPLKGRKRAAVAEAEPADTPINGGDVTSMLVGFGADISKALHAKRKRLEGYTKSSVKSSNLKIEQIWKSQQNERNKLNEDYRKQFSTVFNQWEGDVQKTKDQEEKLANLFRQQQKLFQQMRAAQGQRLKTIRQLMEQFMKSLEELENSHSAEHSTVQNELRKEMAIFQKKILMDTQKQEMASVRNSLQSMLM
ncbi:synaptonemal complex protein 3 [Amia ocellicauda]|uniref:synaptonemal complex protein 3 n=1 Tax=Amia ocellicauda TaxID=2972642 RepID=UPI003464253D